MTKESESAFSSSSKHLARNVAALATASVGMVRPMEAIAEP